MMKIKRMNGKEFWLQVKKHEAKVYDSPVYAAYDNMTPHEASGLETRKKFLKDRIEIFYGLFDDKNHFAGWCGSIQTRPNELYMINSAVLPKFQRRGWYTKMAKLMLKEAKKLGFQVVISNHIASNNSVIIAKLKLGFVISGMEILDEVGVLVKLVHFLNPMRMEVMRFRTGEVYPSLKTKKLLRLNK